MLRNRELARLVAAYAFCACALAFGAYVTAASGVFAATSPRGLAAACAGWTLAVAGALAVPVAAATCARYRALARLAEGIDAALHGTRRLSVERMREGELAILANEIEKLFGRLVRANEDLDHEKRALADALADISHQLRTPLTTLALTVELLRREGSEAHRRDELLRRADMLLGQVSWLVEALLKLARIDAGIVRLERATVAASEVARRAAAPLEIAYELKGVDLALDVQGEPTFVGDAAWTTEALENVLKNCLEHTPTGGSVRVTVGEDALACRISVEDTGPGIAPEDLPHVFERFYRGRAAEARGTDKVDPAGVGIGLALARELVSAEGGALTAANRAEGGARFELAFFKTAV